MGQELTGTSTAADVRRGITGHLFLSTFGRGADRGFLSSQRICQWADGCWTLHKGRHWMFRLPPAWLRQQHVDQHVYPQIHLRLPRRRAPFGLGVATPTKFLWRTKLLGFVLHLAIGSMQSSTRMPRLSPDSPNLMYEIEMAASVCPVPTQSPSDGLPVCLALWRDRMGRVAHWDISWLLGQ